MALTTEVFIFEASDAHRDDPKRIFGAFDLGLQAEGAQSPLYHGNQIANANTVYAFLDWDSYEAHAAFVTSASYTALSEILVPCISQTRTPDMYHVQFSSPATLACQQPITEVRILTLKAQENRATVVGMLSKVSEKSGKLLVFGETREDKNKYIILRGWKSVEEYQETIAKPEVAAGLEKLGSLTNDEHTHFTSLSQYRRSE